MSVESGFNARDFLKQLTELPGVYRMQDACGEILYVGKAKNLKKRVSSYFRSTGLSVKTRSLVSKIAAIEVTVTGSETEALILEQNLIKALKPPYNILLRDDKSYPYIYLSSDKTYPSLSLMRTRSKNRKGEYFGPFPSAGSVRESLGILEKIFKVRQCEESFFKNRSRPCLQYQIKRCKGPCVGLVGEEEYASDVQHARMFLQGKNPEIIRQLIEQMELASQQLQFEKAAELRDEIGHLRHVQESQAVESGQADIDVVAIEGSSGVCCISMLYVRKGRVLGQKNYFPKLTLEQDETDVLATFVEQYYVGQAGTHDLPKEVIHAAKLENGGAIADAIKQVSGRDVRFASRVRTERAQWRKLAQTNAKNALASFLSSRENMFKRFQSLQDMLKLDSPPKRMECFDISHSSGERTVASCVVFGESGPLKSDYRTYNIEGITPGDDYAAMGQALKRRYQKLRLNPEKCPDILFVDGGKGQLGVALDVLKEMPVAGMQVIGIAKGVTRKPGFETLLLPTESDQIGTLECQPDNPGLHLIQHIRDEAHRFAITGHRNRRDKARRTSTLEGIEGVGPKRRRELLKYFGGLAGVKRASIEEIAKVPGISSILAEHIYHTLHGA